MSVSSRPEPACSISGAANCVPQWLSQIVADRDETKFQIALPVIKAIRSQPQPATNKAVLHALGVMESQPISSPRPATKERFTPLSPRAGKVGFSRLDSMATGVRFTNQLSEAALRRNQILELGSGVALGDVDGDGLPDLYLCALEGSNRLYRNHGNWKFEDVTLKAGLEVSLQPSTGAVMADDDYVTVMLPRKYPDPRKPGAEYYTTWFDTWRFVDGKADEHWDPATIAPPAAK